MKILALSSGLLIAFAGSAVASTKAPSHSSTDLKHVEQSQTNLTSQQSTGFFDQYGHQINIQNNRTNEPVYSTYGSQRCPRPSLYGEVNHGASWYGRDSHNSQIAVGAHIPLGDGGCNKRVQQTFCVGLFDKGYTTDDCENSGLRRLAKEPVSIQPPPRKEAPPEVIFVPEPPAEPEAPAVKGLY